MGWMQILTMKKGMTMKNVVFLFTVSMIFAWVVEATGNGLKLWTEPPKKLVYCGWDSPNTRYLRDNIREIEKMPYDGLRIMVEAWGEKDGKRTLAHDYTIYQNWTWRYEWFMKAVEDIKATKFEKFTENFISTTTVGNIDWFDDEAWRAVCNNFGIMAKIAREVSFKGLIFDPEAYSNQWRYSGKNGRTYEETSLKARQRGREFIKAICKEYPNIKIFSFFWFSCMQSIATSPDPHMAGAGSVYGLFLPFTNGVYDEISPGAVIIDGWEGGYGCRNLSDYHKIVYDYKKSSMLLTAPENIEKMRRQTQLGVATYLDAYIKTDIYGILKDNPGMSQCEVLTRNLGYALETSDEYAWTWSEHKWWPVKFRWGFMDAAIKKSGIGELWADAIPGIAEAIEKARDINAYLGTKAKSGDMTNLVKNGGFEIAGKSIGSIDNPPDCEMSILSGWEMWQKKKISSGNFGKEQGDSVAYHGTSAAVAKNMNEGCILQSIPAEAGKRYQVKALCQNNGTGMAQLYIAWRGASGKWMAIGQNVTVPFGRQLGNGWVEAKYIVRVPEKASYLVVELFVKNQTKETDKCYFDQVEVYKVD